MTRIVIGLGSNIQPQANLITAADLLREEWPDMRFSGVYRSKAVGYAKQDDFLNAVAVAETDRDALSVHGKLKQIEEALGKEIAFANGPRTIDLDLLLYGDERIDEPGLTVPHPRMLERRFVLEPLVELIDGKEWKEALGNVKDQECEKTDLEL
jgi:2-amino-4-hydroxy-6-hydroxymethyldihydropteridine diphosphokinase